MSHPRPTAAPCSTGKPDPTAVAVDLDVLLANPKDYAGKVVRVRGFMTNRKENQGLFRDRASSEHLTIDGQRVVQCPKPFVGIHAMRALTLDVDVDALAMFHRRQVTIEGKFDPCLLGHLDMYSGGLSQVTSIECLAD